MSVYYKSIKDVKGLAEDLGIDEEKIKKLQKREAHIEGETLDKVLNAMNNEENNIQRNIKKAEVFKWYQETNLKELRLKFGYKKQTQVAKILKLHPSTICNLEKKSQNRYSDVLQKVYDFYHNDFNKKEFINEEDEEESKIEDKVKNKAKKEVTNKPEEVGQPKYILDIDFLENRIVKLEEENSKLKRQIMLYEKLIERL